MLALWGGLQCALASTEIYIVQEGVVARLQADELSLKVMLTLVGTLLLLRHAAHSQTLLCYCSLICREAVQP